GPLVILTLLYFLVRGGSNRPDVDVVNLDPGPLGAAVAGDLLHSTRIAATPTDLDRARRDLRDGRIAGYVLLPADFSPRAQGQRDLAPEIHLEGTQPGLDQPVVAAVSESMVSALTRLAPLAGVPVPKLDVKVEYLHGGPGLDTLDYFGAGFIGLVVFFLVFVVTIVSFLRERSQGTLERLMASPLRRGEIVAGYMLGFTILAAVQAIEVVLFTLFVLHVHNEGNLGLILLITLLMAIASVNLGIFLSMFARTEFQAVQFIPLVIAPQFVLSGIVFPVSSEPRWLQYVSNVLPLTYGVDGLREVMLKGAGLGWPAFQLDAAVVAGFLVAAAALAGATLRRR